MSSRSAPNSLASLVRSVRHLAAWAAQPIDVESLAWQLVKACTSPADLYRLAQRRRQARAQAQGGASARGAADASVAIAMSALAAGSAVAWGVAYEVTSPSELAFLALRAALQFLATSAAVATACWSIANRLRAPQTLPHNTVQYVEWLYAWDVACAAFVPLFMCLDVVQFVLLPLMLAPESGVAVGVVGVSAQKWISAIVANTIYAIAGVLFWHSIFRGFVELTFVRRANVFLVPGLVCAFVGAACSVFGLNLSNLLLRAF